MIELGWWAISGEALMSMLRRANAGEDPDLIYAEQYANSDHERVEKPLELQWCTTHDDVWGDHVDWAYRDDEDGEEEKPVFCYSAYYNGGKADCQFVKRALMPADE